jgi:hypothetical protein
VPAASGPVLVPNRDASRITPRTAIIVGIKVDPKGVNVDGVRIQMRRSID